MFFGPSGRDHDSQKPILSIFGDTRTLNTFPAEIPNHFKEIFVLESQHFGNRSILNVERAGSKHPEDPSSKFLEILKHGINIFQKA